MIGFCPPSGHWGKHWHDAPHPQHRYAHRSAGSQRPDDERLGSDGDNDEWSELRSAFGWSGRGVGGHGPWRDFTPSEDTRAPHTDRHLRGAAGGDDDPFAGGRGWSGEDMFRRMRAFGRRFGGPGGPGRPGRPGRPLGQGDLRWLVLDLIAAQPRHGYEIIKAIEEAFDGHYTPSPGVIYPTLTLLEETGLISGETHGSKKRYSLTDEGHAELAAHSADIQAVRDRLSRARARFGDAPPPEVFRALDNMRGALQVRLARGRLSAEAVQTVTAAIDRAAAEIERS